MSKVFPLEHYSFSSLSQVQECPYSFYLERIDKDAVPEENAFSENGSLVHDLFEQNLSGLLSNEQMASQYKRRYKLQVKTKWPKVFGNDVGESTYKKISQYLENYHTFDQYEILGVEQAFETNIGDDVFVGVVDLIARDKDGNLCIVDHKSKSLSAFRKKSKQMYRQLYLYAKYIHQKYGFFPDVLQFHLFKQNGKIVSTKFSMNEYEQTIKWAMDMIRTIKQNDLFIDWMTMKDESDLFCQQICSVRKCCPNGG